jgi:hypothetical protein
MLATTPLTIPATSPTTSPLMDNAFDIYYDIDYNISDNGALTSLNLSSNYLEVEGATIIANAIKVMKVCDCGSFGTIFMPI